MPQVAIMIGGRTFEVACQEGEEPFLHAAAAMLDTEATALSGAVGRLPEAKMLLMAGLMLADKTASVEDRISVIEARLAERDQELEAMRNAPAPEPERIEVPIVPTAVTETLAEIAARAESLAAAIEEKAG